MIIINNQYLNTLVYFFVLVVEYIQSSTRPIIWMGALRLMPLMVIYQVIMWACLSAKFMNPQRAKGAPQVNTPVKRKITPSGRVILQRRRQVMIVESVPAKDENASTTQ
jgi:hypothetical protein